MNLHELQLKNISTIYIGKDHHCRCGCGGKYVSSSFMDNPRSEVNDIQILNLLQRAQKYNKKYNTAEYGETYINVSMKNNRCICIYTDELKKGI